MAECPHDREKELLGDERKQALGKDDAGELAIDKDEVDGDLVVPRILVSPRMILDPPELPAFGDADPFARFRDELEEGHVLIEQHRFPAGELHALPQVRFEIAVEIGQLVAQFEQSQVKAPAEREAGERRSQQDRGPPAWRPDLPHPSALG